MTFRDDHEAMLARLEALDRRVAAHDAELAARDRALEEARQRIAELSRREDPALAAARAQILELEAEVQRLARELVDREATIRDLRKLRGVAEPAEPARGAAVLAPDPGADPRAQAERYLAAGLASYQAGDRAGATRLFQRGLAFVPDHPELLRAVRRYT